MFCWHRWTVIEKTEQPSKIELAYDCDVAIKGRGKAAMDATVRPVIVTYRCSKCGAEKVERI